MTKHLIHILLAAAAMPLFAEDPHRLTANVPFNFTAGDKVFQAGDYQVTKTNNGVITIKSADRKDSAFLLTNPVIASKVSTTGRLLFHRTGERYILSEIWEPGNNTGSMLLPSKADRELRSRSDVPARARVSVALR